MFNSYSHMVLSLAKPGSEIMPTLTEEKIEILHMAIGLAGEASETFEAVLKCQPTEVIIEELGDMHFYFKGLICCADINYINPSVYVRPKFVIDAATALTVNCGKILDECKKFVFYNKELNEQAVVELCQEVLFYLDFVAGEFGMNRKQVQKINMDKLEARYSTGKFSDEQAKERADKQEPHRLV